MEGLTLITPTELYNLLNQGSVHPVLSDPNYLLLLDARSKANYEESHIITAKKAPLNKNEFVVPYDAELECKQYVIVYDGHSASLKEEGMAMNCAKVMWDMGSRNPVYVLNGGYEEFSALYPFLRTQTIIYMPRELDEIKTYPTEVIPGFLYLGNWRQGNAAYIQKDLKIKAHVSCDTEPETFFKVDDSALKWVAIEDNPQSDLYSHIKPVCQFLNQQKEKKSCVLIFSRLGISRSAALCLAYIMYYFKRPLGEAYDHLLRCCSTVRPNRGFVEQLALFELHLFGRRKTDISDPEF